MFYVFGTVLDPCSNYIYAYTVKCKNQVVSYIPDFCQVSVVEEKRSHLYLMRCCLSPEHGGGHDFRPAHRLMWELEHGTPPPSKVASIRPINGDWLDMEPSNWELVSTSKLRKEAVEKKRGIVTKKTCVMCDEYLPIEKFSPKRNFCKKCHSSRVNDNVKEREKHIRDFNCYIVNGRHYHLTTKEETYLFFLRQYYSKLRENSTDREYRREAEMARAEIRRALKSNLD